MPIKKSAKIEITTLERIILLHRGIIFNKVLLGLPLFESWCKKFFLVLHDFYKI